MTEIAAITKGPWIHLGGDEIKDPNYKEFVIKADSIVSGTGKISIGWEEVTQAKVDESLISQTWHGTVESVVDVKIIESLCGHFYLDHGNYPGQENTQKWCKKNGVSLQDSYNYTTDNTNIIGVEATVWTEFVLNNEMMDYRFWPRILAVAEVAWSPLETRDFKDFTDRVAIHGDRLNAMGIHFHQSPEVKWNEGIKNPIPNSIFSGFRVSE